MSRCSCQDMCRADVPWSYNSRVDHRACGRSHGKRVCIDGKHEQAHGALDIPGDQRVFHYTGDVLFAVVSDSERSTCSSNTFRSRCSGGVRPLT